MATNTQPQETPEYCTFREHYDRLVTAILDPLLLAARLFARNMIDSTVKEEMSVLGLSRVYRNNALLSAVEMQIRTDPRMFGVFLSALNEDPSMQSLVESMQSKCFICEDINHLGSLPTNLKCPKTKQSLLYIHQLLSRL